MNQLDTIEQMVLPMVRSQITRAIQVTTVTPSPLLLNLREAFADHATQQSINSQSQLMLAGSAAQNPASTTTAHIQLTQATAAANIQSTQRMTQTGPTTMADTTMAEQIREVPPQQQIQAIQQSDTTALPVLISQAQYLSPHIDPSFQPQYIAHLHDQLMHMDHFTDIQFNQSIQDPALSQSHPAVQPRTSSNFSTSDYSSNPSSDSDGSIQRSQCGNAVNSLNTDSYLVVEQLSVADNSRRTKYAFSLDGYRGSSGNSSAFGGPATPSSCASSRYIKPSPAPLGLCLICELHNS